MIEKVYPVAFEVAGRHAMFTRPDTGAAPISYPAPTRTALKGMFESVAFSRDAYFEPEWVEICSPVVFQRYTTNYRGPFRKSGTVAFQDFSTILCDVCYKVYGNVIGLSPPTSSENPAHKLQEIFLRRLQKGQFYTTPFLGLKEFVPTYFGPLREETFADETINTQIASMLVGMYTSKISGKVSPQFAHDLRIRMGVLHFDE